MTSIISTGCPAARKPFQGFVHFRFGGEFPAWHGKSVALTLLHPDAKRAIVDPPGSSTSFCAVGAVITPKTFEANAAQASRSRASATM